MPQISVLGIGFAGLDIIKNGTDELILPGGTCGNVISILASKFSLKADIIKSAYSDDWDDVVNCLWKQIGVGVINCGDAAKPLPRVVEVVNGTSNQQYTICPKCKSKLLDISLPATNKLNDLEDTLSRYDLLYYDRISEGTKYLLDNFRRNKKWSFYEPNSARNYNNWLKNISQCDVVKFSEDRIPRSFRDKLLQDLNMMERKTRIVLITHSQRGYSYSIFNGKCMSDLRTINVSKFTNIVDSSGAGDWLSAGFIYKLLQNYSTPIEIVDEQVIIDALEFGHSLAKIACTNLGALGEIFRTQSYQITESKYKCDFCKLQ